MAKKTCETRANPNKRSIAFAIRNMPNKVATIGIVLFIFASASSYLEIWAIPSSNLLGVPFHSQETTYYCGPACVQMTIDYMFGELISQNKLATEMHTDPIKGETDPSMMGVPFSGRGHSSMESRGMTLDELKKQNSDGSILIILIWFDTNHKYGHYVVVTGYDETGIFVNDPWPSNWGQPKGRTTGKNAFIPYALLADLWTYSNKWALIVPTPAHALIPTAILVLGVLAVCFLGGFAYLMLKRARLREPYVQRAFSEAMDYLS